ncbi:MAG TPA: VWA domain-containing protein [Acidimicrobiales bacterium]|nr:VWA domain-containing protein [Acidimicrobiales bacterium]
MLDVLSGFVSELRAAGIPVSLTEHLDAAEAMRHVPLEDREALKYALGASLVKSSSHWHAFETAFEVYFSLRGPEYTIDENSAGKANEEKGKTSGDSGRQGSGRGGGSGQDAMTPEELAELLYKALLGSNDSMITAVARHAVARFAGMEAGRPVGGTYYLYRTLRNLDLDGVMQRLMEQARTGAIAAPGQGDAEGSGASGLTGLEERLVRDEYQSRIDKLRQEIENEIRRRLVADRGSEALAKSLRKPLPEDIDFMHATRDELVALRGALQPLSRKLAVRLARKRRHGRKGPLDFRSTVRHSLSTGGVPVDPRFKYPRPSKPEIIVIADISGSVASFARFTLHLVHAIASQFSKVRSFVFIDGIDEVTRFFEGTDDPAEAVHRINTEADVVWVDGHSDYGHALTVFWERWGEEINAKSSVLLLGDARNNYHASHSWVVKEIQKKARHVYWLNPEPRSYWDSGDSIVGEYAIHCDDVVECRTLRQLERFVGELA